ncbi:plasma membrane-type ca(2+)-atpase a1 pmcaa1, partial [Cystoisospora suis]
MPGLLEEVVELPRLFRENWLKSLGVYTADHPLLVFLLLSLTLSQIFLNYFFLQYFPVPILLTWFQVTQSLISAYILGEFGHAFHSYRYFPRLKRPRLRLLLRYLPYSLSYLFFSICTNLLIAKLSSPIYIPITSALSVGLHQVLSLLGCSYNSLSSPFVDVSYLKWISTAFLLLPSFLYCAVFSGVFSYTLLSTAATILFRAILLPKALHLVNEELRERDAGISSSSPPPRPLAIREGGEESQRRCDGREEEEQGDPEKRRREQEEDERRKKLLDGRNRSKRVARGGGGGGGAILNFYHNLTGFLVLLFPAWCFDEFSAFSPFLLTPPSSFLPDSSPPLSSSSFPSSLLLFLSSFLCDKRYWYLIGCCICVGFLSFLKNVIGNRLMLDGGASRWKSLEVISLFLLFLFSFFLCFSSPSFSSSSSFSGLGAALPSTMMISGVVYFFILTGRVLGTLADDLGKEEERKLQQSHLRISLLHHDDREREREEEEWTREGADRRNRRTRGNREGEEEDLEDLHRPHHGERLSPQRRGSLESISSVPSAALSSSSSAIVPYPSGSSSVTSSSSAYIRRRRTRDLSDEPVLFIHSDGPATSFKQGSPEDEWLEDEDEDETRIYVNRRSQLISIVQAYVTRTFDEDLELIDSMGGIKSIVECLDSNVTDGLPIPPSSSSSSSGFLSSTASSLMIGTPRQQVSKLTTFLSRQLNSFLHPAPSHAEKKEEKRRGEEELHPLSSSSSPRGGQRRKRGGGEEGSNQLQCPLMEGSPVDLETSSTDLLESKRGPASPSSALGKDHYLSLKDEREGASALKRSSSGESGSSNRTLTSSTFLLGKGDANPPQDRPSSWIGSVLGSALSFTGGPGAADKEKNTSIAREGHENQQKLSSRHRNLLKLQQKRYGVNRLPRRSLTSFWNLVLEAANDATLKILMCCGLLSIVLALLFSKEPLIEAVEGFAIWVAVLVVVLVTAINDWMKEQQFAQLSVVKDDKKCTVLRNGGKPIQISVFDLVVGDILLLEAGDEIPADALLIQGRDMKVDESSLTGESDMIRKDIFNVCYDEALNYLLQEKKAKNRNHPNSPSFSSSYHVHLPDGDPKEPDLLDNEQDDDRSPPSPAHSHRLQDPPLDGEKEHRDGRAKQEDLSPVDHSSHDLRSIVTIPGDSSSSSGNGGGGGAGGVVQHHAVPSPVLLSGTTVNTGSGLGLVIAVGSYSQVGQMFQKLAYDAEPTPLQMKLNALAEDIGNFGLISAVIAFFVLLFEFWFMFFLQSSSSSLERPRESTIDIIHDHVEFFVTAITILVVAVPEGLPLAVTISLAYSIGQMLKEQNYVRRLAACEIMGGANEICSDKTGTLTKNQMTVTQFWNGSTLLYTSSSSSSSSSFSSSSSNASTRYTATTATARTKRGGEEEEGISGGGHKKTSGLCYHTEKFGREAESILQHRDERWEILMQAIALNSTAFLEVDPSLNSSSSLLLKQLSSKASPRQGQGDQDRQNPSLMIRQGSRLSHGASSSSSSSSAIQIRGVGEEEEEREEEERLEKMKKNAKHVGSPTECALLAFQDFECRGDYDLIRRKYIGEGGESANLIERIDFSSDRKMMSTIVDISSSSSSPLQMKARKKSASQVGTAQDGERRETREEEEDFGGEQGEREKKTSSSSPPPPSQGRRKYRVFVKGASERVLRQCKYFDLGDGELIELTDSIRSQIEREVINKMAGEALRTIGLAYRDIDPEKEVDWREPASGGGREGEQEGEEKEKRKKGDNEASHDDTPNSNSSSSNVNYIKAETNLICLGIAGIEDPVRDEVPHAVLQCQRAGIKVRMITGDNIITAKAIGKKCHIYHENEGGLAMLGSEFTRLVGGVICERCRTEICDCAVDLKTSEEQGKPLRVDVIRDMSAFDRICRHLEILARSQPNDKYTLVTALKQKGRVVAVTGDGTNDAPALKKADVGFSMGISGKEVAKQAADIVMLDDNFTCIVKAIKWGRNVYDNIRRFLQFQLTVNIVAVVLTVLCAVLERESPLSAVQMLWINLIMDSFASLALATEPPTDRLLHRKPQGRDSYLISRSMIVTIVSSSIYQLIVMILLIFYGEHFLPETKWTFLTDEKRKEYNFCEFSDCNYETYTGTRMRSGRRYQLFSTEEDYKPDWERELGPSRHGTFVFNTFVFMQIFNMFNARDVEDDDEEDEVGEGEEEVEDLGGRNGAPPNERRKKKMKRGTTLYESILIMARNRLGIGIWIFILSCQILITEYGGRLLGSMYGRTPESVVIPQDSLYKIAPEFGKREELLEETHSIALELRGRTPDRINERLGLASYTFAKKYAKKARLMTISRLRRRQSYPYYHQSNPEHGLNSQSPRSLIDGVSSSSSSYYATMTSRRGIIG